MQQKKRGAVRQQKPCSRDGIGWLISHHCCGMAALLGNSGLNGCILRLEHELHQQADMLTYF